MKQSGVTIATARRNRRRVNREARLADLEQDIEPFFTSLTRHFAEAVTNPFSDEAIGAVIPDQWAPPTIPAMDRLTVDFDPALLGALFDSPFDDINVSGMFFAIVPRSLAVGWLAQQDLQTVALDAPFYQDLCGIYPLTDTFAATDDEPLAHMYCLFFAMLGDSAGTFNAGPTFVAIDAQAGKYRAGFNCIPFSRYSALRESASGGRIVGAGLKITSDEAPIETGGTVYGGWMPLEDMFQAAVLAAATYPDTVDTSDGDAKTEVDPGFMVNSVGIESIIPPSRLMRSRRGATVLLNQSQRMSLGKRIAPASLTSKVAIEAYNHNSAHNQRYRRRKRLRDVATVGSSNIQDSLRYRHTYRGIDGVTVRYSPLQSSKQETFQPAYEDALFDEYSLPGSQRNTNVGVGVGVHDLIGASDYVPCAVWRFNSSDDVYSLRVEARVHIQCEPDGSCPFMTTTVVPDPNYSHLQILLENKDAFPVVSKAQSFASFITGVTKALKTVKMGIKGVGKVADTVSHIAKLFA
jgi:hypothetical protein